MAKTTSIIHAGLCGQIGREFVFKTRNGKTFVSKFPDMSNIIASGGQRDCRSKFEQAVAYSQFMISDPERKRKIARHLRKKRKRGTVYHYLIKEFMRGRVRGELPEDVCNELLPSTTQTAATAPSSIQVEAQHPVELCSRVVEKLNERQWYDYLPAMRSDFQSLPFR